MEAQPTQEEIDAWVQFYLDASNDPELRRSLPRTSFSESQGEWDDGYVITPPVTEARPLPVPIKRNFFAQAFKQLMANPDEIDKRLEQDNAMLKKAKALLGMSDDEETS